MATEEKAKTPQSSVVTKEDEIVEDFSAKNEGTDPSMEEEETEVPETCVATEEDEIVEDFSEPNEGTDPSMEEEETEVPETCVATEEDEIVEVVEDFSEPNEGTDPSMEEEETEVPENSVATEEDDVVVAEYDVYFNPPDPSSSLYVLQYPLRPSWRPYDLDKRCTEVRFKPDTCEVEMDLSIDMNSDNFDVRSNDQFRMNKQVLTGKKVCSSSNQAVQYAVGVLFGKKLVLNPVKDVVQLRPSMEYLDSDGSKKRNDPNVIVEEGSSNDVRSGQSSEQPWVSLKYHSSTSELAQRCLTRMMTTQNDPLHLQFSMNPLNYLNSLCPITKMQSSRPSRRFLLTLPLEERIKTLLIEGPSVQRFAAITHLAPNDPVEDVLEEVQKYAMLVQGLWVVKTRVRYPNTKGSELLARDYALLLFSKSPAFKDTELDFLGSFKSTEKVLVVLREIAVERPYCKDWKFIEPTDVSFIKHYPNVVEQQQKAWQGHDQHLQQIVDERRARARIGANSKTSGRPGLSLLPHEGGVGPSTSMSKETHKVSRPPLEEHDTEALKNALLRIFHMYQVCSFQRILQFLQDNVAAAIDEADLRSLLSTIAVDVHGVYVLKSSPRHPALDRIREQVIDLFRINKPNAKLMRSHLQGGIISNLGVMPTETDLRKVLEECCVSSGNKWVLKSG